MDRQGYYSKHASLALIAQRFQAMGIWPMIDEEVMIKQKVLQHTPMDKLLDGFITMLMGGRGLVEINTRLRCDVAIQRAFGRSGCADQSTVSDTLDECTLTNVQEMRRAMTRILHQHSAAVAAVAAVEACHTTAQTMGHPMMGQVLRVMDVDTVGLPAGRQGEGVTKGYFSGRRNQYGRQLGRVLATAHDEILVERLYTGKRQLEHSLVDLVLAAEELLGLTENQRENTVLRVDAGGGSDANINRLLDRGYHLVIKAHNWQRADKLAVSVVEWQRDPKETHREVGWVTQPHDYVRTTRQLMVRTLTPKGKLRHRLLISSLSDEQLCACFSLDLPNGTPWPLLYAYDLRGGGIETQNRCDRQGLGLGQRNKHRFAAQEMLILLGQVAHNFLIWMRNELARVDSHFTSFGLKRMVRDVLAIDGLVWIDSQGTVIDIELNPHHPLTASLNAAFARSLSQPYV